MFKVRHEGKRNCWRISKTNLPEDFFRNKKLKASILNRSKKPVLLSQNGLLKVSVFVAEG